MYDKYNEENKKRIKILEQQICAGHTEGKIDGCQVSVTSGFFDTSGFSTLPVFPTLSAQIDCRCALQVNTFLFTNRVIILGEFSPNRVIVYFETM
jgi:hypothetical protein